MNEIIINNPNKNTFKVIETPSGAIIILNQTEPPILKNGDAYFYIVFNAMKGFFTWESVWRDSEIDMSLYSLGNVFVDRSESDQLAGEFNQRLLLRTKTTNAERHK